MKFRVGDKTYRWRMPLWMKYVIASAVALGTFLAMFQVYFTEIGHPMWG